MGWFTAVLDTDPDEQVYRGDPAALVDALGEMLELIRDRPAWHAHAACRGAGTAAFFPTPGQSSRPAKDMCDECPVRVECYDAGAGEAGMWGGVSERNRRERQAA